MPTTFQRTALCASCLLAACCTYQEVKMEDPAPVAKQRQLETLETLATLEEQVAAVAESFPEVQKARVYIRPQASIVILSPVGEWKIPQKTIDSINEYVMRETGQRMEQITIKVTRAPVKNPERATREGAQE